MKRLQFLFVMILAASCNSVQTSYDIDKTANFAKYKTYAYTEDAMKLGVSDLDRQRIISSVDTEMAARGMTKTQDNSDALVDLIIKAQQKVEATATNTGGMYGRYGWGGGYGGTTQISYDQYIEGTLFINVIDKSSEKIVWQGRGTKTLDETASPSKKETNIKYAVKSIYYNYPVKPLPAKKK